MASEQKKPTAPLPWNKDSYTKAGLLRSAMIEKMREYRQGTNAYPIQNPVQRLALDLFDRIESKELGIADIEDLIQRLTVNGFLFRAQRLQAYLGPCSRRENEKRLRACLEALTIDADGATMSFERFSEALEREVYGIVFTGHPTFGISRPLTHTLADLAVREDLAEVSGYDDFVRKLAGEIAAEQHDTHERLNLSEELAFGRQVTAHAQGTLTRVYEIALDIAAEKYPERWMELTPRLLTLASWVGFDIDGRTDIDWTESLRVRLRSQAQQLKRYIGDLKEIETILAKDGGARPDLIAPLATRVQEAYAQALAEIDLLPHGGGDTEKVKAFSQRLAETRETRLVDPDELIQRINKIIEAGVSPAAIRKLVILRARMANLGLGVAHVHVRINAIQLINAIRHDVGLEADPDDSRYRRTYLRKLNELLDGVEPASINFGSVLEERMTAKRMFMLVTQMTKYIDSAVPIRFLIAECDSIFIVLTALYFARLFGVADRVDISPLFETADALEHGNEIVAELLKNEHFRDYLRARGRLSIETGYSDSGRYIGQVTASLAIERLHMKICRSMAEAGLEGVDVVMFDTHGESIGRGAHPVSFADRLDYVVTPASRALFKNAGVGLIRETSFQGGDGFVFFANPDIAFATMTRVLEYALSEPKTPEEDAFYEDTDYSLEFFMTLKTFHERMVENPDYNALLHVFGPNLLYPTGSRMVKREGSSRDKPDYAHPSHIRAIPNNAILQQMGFLANSCGGLGRAIMRNQEHFIEVYKNSDRCRRFIALAAHARYRSSLSALGSYGRLFDPVAWLLRASKRENKTRAEHMQRLAALLAQDDTYEKLNRMFHIYLRDAIAFDEGIAALGDSGLPLVANDEGRTDMALLHTVRIALINEIFLLIVRIPQFRSEPDVTIEEVLRQLLELDVPRSVAVLQRAFPSSAESSDNPALFGEEASYRADGGHGYAREQRELFTPMLELHDMVRRVSVAISQIMGAVG